MRYLQRYRSNTQTVWNSYWLASYIHATPRCCTSPLLSQPHLIQFFEVARFSAPAWLSGGGSCRQALAPRQTCSTISRLGRIFYMSKSKRLDWRCSIPNPPPSSSASVANNEKRKKISKLTGNTTTTSFSSFTTTAR